MQGHGQKVQGLVNLKFQSQRGLIKVQHIKCILVITPNNSSPKSKSLNYLRNLNLEKWKFKI